jgi:environmental stress-induced protein Ves
VRERTESRGHAPGKRTDTFDQSKATVELKGRFSGGTFKGFVREVDFVEGSGIVCDTLERKFTAKRR